MLGSSANGMAWSILPESSSASSKKVVPGDGMAGAVVAANGRHGRNWAVPALKFMMPRTIR
jgi:hypothetical protein